MKIMKGTKLKPVIIGKKSPRQLMVCLVKTYDKLCMLEGRTAIPSIRVPLRQNIVNETIMVKFIVQPPVQSPASDELVAPSVDELPMTIIPFVTAIRQERYTHIRLLCIWKVTLTYDDIISLAGLLDKGDYPLRHIELVDCIINARCLQRLAISFNNCVTLSSIVLDHNEFGDEGCRGLCSALRGNKTMLSISMCFCDLGVASGSMLSVLVATTAVRELILDGNNLECEGAMALIQPCVEQAMIEEKDRTDKLQREADEQLAVQTEKENAKKRMYAISEYGATTDVSTEAKETPKKKKKRKGKKKKTKAPPPKPTIGPWIYKLHLADNGIDTMGTGGGPQLLITMQKFAQLIACSKCLEELDLNYNLIGDLGGQELKQALMHRQETGYPSIKMRTTHRMLQTTLTTIIKLAAGLQKKKKKGKKKAKK